MSGSTAAHVNQHKASNGTGELASGSHIITKNSNNTNNSNNNRNI